MRAVILLLLLLILLRSLWPISLVQAANTGTRTAGSSAAVTSSAGDNNGFETLFGVPNPKDSTTSNDSGIESLNSGTATSTNCATANTTSDKHDFSNFGINLPAGATVRGIVVAVEGRYDSNTGTNTVCAHLSYDEGSNWSAGNNSGDINSTDATSTLGTSADLWGRSSWSASELNNTNFRVRLMTLVANVNRDFFLDYLTVTVYYNEAPGVPTLNTPANGATTVSLTPLFRMTATDPDSNNLSYKVTIYSDSGCSTVVQTNDQAISGTGWSGTDATCTNNPTSCYTSGMQGTFQTQTALAANTQYWWKAAAKDPDGTGNFTDSSACNNFTTALISVTVSDGVVSYGLVSLGASKDTTAGSINDTQTATNNGNANQNINIKGQNSASWMLGWAAGANTYVHRFCISGSGSPDPCDSAAVWNVLTTSYQTLATAVAPLGTVIVDLSLIMPTSTGNTSQQAVDVVIQAVSP